MYNIKQFADAAAMQRGNGMFFGKIKKG